MAMGMREFFVSSYGFKATTVNGLRFHVLSGLGARQIKVNDRHNIVNNLSTLATVE
jgi:hypothetical protein